MKKHVANIISLSRVAGAIALFFFNSLSKAFLAIYIFCGLTDLIDGPIARKLKTTSPLGATLDTVGDVATYLALTKVLIIKNLVPFWILLWFISTMLIFIVAAFISKHRFYKLYLPHTYLGKIFGGVIFVLPVAIQFMPSYIWLSVICAISTVHAFELIYVQLKNKDADDFVPSALHVKKS